MKYVVELSDDKGCSFVLFERETSTHAVARDQCVEEALFIRKSFTKQFQKRTKMHVKGYNSWGDVVEEIPIYTPEEEAGKESFLKRYFTP